MHLSRQTEGYESKACKTFLISNVGPLLTHLSFQMVSVKYAYQISTLLHRRLCHPACTYSNQMNQRVLSLNRLVFEVDI